jgi:hypothetical protein
MNWFKSKDIRRVEIRATNVNYVARGLWKKIGFVPYVTTMFREN